MKMYLKCRPQKGIHFISAWLYQLLYVISGYMRSMELDHPKAFDNEVTFFLEFNQQNHFADIVDSIA